MNWVFRTLSTSVGKKLLMAATGGFFLLFLAVHLAGNLTIYAGPAAFNAYVERLHSLGALLVAAEVLMLLAAVIHIVTGLMLYLENLRARPVPYAVDRSGGGGRTLSSRTMPYTGLLILLFVAFHLGNASRFFADHASRNTFDILAEIFSHKAYVAVYVAAMVVVALHVRHGVWSAFQTTGLSHPKYTPSIEKLSVAFAVLVGAGFASLPLVFAFMK